MRSIYLSKSESVEEMVAPASLLILMVRLFHSRLDNPLAGRSIRNPVGDAVYVLGSTGVELHMLVCR